MLPTTVVVVDNSPDFRAAAMELLSERGFEVVAAVSDADQSLVAVTRECPNGILLDIELSGTDGFSVSSLLAAACPSARIVLTSASIAHVPDNVLRCCGAVAFVPKEELAAVDLGVLFRPGGT